MGGRKDDGGGHPVDALVKECRSEYREGIRWGFGWHWCWAYGESHDGGSRLGVGQGSTKPSTRINRALGRCRPLGGKSMPNMVGEFNDTLQKPTTWRPSHTCWASSLVGARTRTQGAAGSRPWILPVCFCILAWTRPGGGGPEDTEPGT